MARDKVKRLFFSRLIKRSLVLGFVLSAFITVPVFRVHAGFMSFVTNLFNIASSAPETTPNSQTMPLLKAPRSAENTNNSTGGGEVIVVDNSALDAENTFVEGDSTSSGKNGSQISLYVVKNGDSLSQIAEMFDVSINTIVWANDIRGSRISPGQQLVILPISGIKHIVKSGETIKGIVTKYKADLGEVLSYNDLTSGSKLAVGDEIIIPDGVVSQSASTSGNSSSGVSTARFSSYPNYAGYFRRPIDGGVKTQGIHGYNGIDIGSPVGTPVMAAATGEIIIARQNGWNGGYGTYVVISHDNGTQTLYAHLNSALVTQGRVVQGQVIGYVGMTGKVTGPHLHFEVRGARNPF